MSDIKIMAKKVISLSSNAIDDLFYEQGKTLSAVIKNGTRSFDCNYSPLFSAAIHQLL